MEGKKLAIADIKDPNYTKTIEGAVTKGRACLMPDIGEEIDSILDHILAKRIQSSANSHYIMMGEKPVDYNMKF